MTENIYIFNKYISTFIVGFEKAFDTTPHEILKSKLLSYGIGGKTLKWINFFMCYRQQRVVVNGVKSDWAPVVSGVPQGTVLGLLLAHLSQRLIDELIVYQWSGVRPSSSTISNIFSSETTWPIKAKFYVEPHWVGGTKVC